MAVLADQIKIYKEIKYFIKVFGALRLHFKVLHFHAIHAPPVHRYILSRVEFYCRRRCQTPYRDLKIGYEKSCQDSDPPSGRPGLKTSSKDEGKEKNSF